MNIAFVSIFVLSLISIVYNGYRFIGCCIGNTIERAKKRIVVSSYVLIAAVIVLIVYNAFFK